MFIKYRHFFQPAQCLEQMIWQEKTLLCARCGAPIAFLYGPEDNQQLYIYLSYRGIENVLSKIRSSLYTSEQDAETDVQKKTQKKFMV